MIASDSVKDLTVTNPNFPDFPEKHLPRPNLVEYIYSQFSSNCRVILVEGEDGQGKTTLLSEFARTYNSRCITYFVEKEPWSQRPEAFLRRLCEQISFALPEPITIDADTYDDIKRLFSRLIQKLEDIANRDKQPYFFVIDGLEYILASSSPESILTVLPPTRRWIYLLGSKRPSDKPHLEHTIFNLQPLTFSIPETRDYLADLLDTEQIKKVTQLSGGVPAYLALVRNACQRVAREERSTVIESLPNKFNQLLEQQWRNLGKLPDDVVHALSLSVFAEEEIPLPEIIETLNIDLSVAELRAVLEGLGFISIDQHSYIQFTSGIWRSFIAEQLQRYRGKVINERIDFLNRKSLQADAILALTKYHQKDQNYSQLLSLCSPQNLSTILTEKKDLALVRDAIKQVASLAYNQGQQEPDLPQLLGFVLRSGILSDIATQFMPRSETEALVALGNYREATELADRMVLPEHRLELLTLVAKSMSVAGEIVPDEITQEIQLLCTDIRTENLWGRFSKIVVELLDVKPSVALSLAKRILGNTSRRSVDSALNHIVVDSQVQIEDVDSSSSSSFAFLHELSESSSKRFQKLSVESAISEVQTIKETSAQLFLIRSWCRANNTELNAWKVIQVGLSLIKEDRDYQPSLRLLCDLAEPFVHNDVDEFWKIEQMFQDIISNGLESPIEELFRLKLLLIRAQARQDFETAVAKLYQTYFEALEITDMIAKSTSFVHVLNALTFLCPQDQGLIEEIKDIIRETVDHLLDNSADHYHATRPIIRALALVDAELAVNIVQKVNLEQRRKLLSLDILQTYFKRKPLVADTAMIRQIIDLVSLNEPFHDHFVVVLLNQLYLNDVDKNMVDIEDFLAEAPKVRQVAPRSFACAFAFLISYRNGQSIEAENYFDTLCGSVSCIDPVWEAIQIGFDLVALIAEVSREHAQKLMDKVRALRVGTPLANVVYIETFINCLYLTIRAFTALVKREEYTEEDLASLISIIEKYIPSTISQVKLLAEIAFGFEMARNRNRFEEIMREQVLPRLEGLADDIERSRAAISIAPCLYRLKRERLTKDYLQSCDQMTVDAVLLDVMVQVLSGKSLSEPIDYDEFAAQADYETALEMVELIRLMQSDQIIYQSIAILTRCLITTHRSGRKLNQREGTNIYNRLKDLVEAKLPDLRNIKHEGYKVASLASLLHIRSITNQRGKEIIPLWNDLAAQTNKIPNVADRVLVRTLVARHMWEYSQTQAAALLNQAEDELSDIPSFTDCADRTFALAEAYYEGKLEDVAKHFVKKVVELFKSVDSRKRDAMVSRVIQFAHSIDPTFADTLTPLIDNPELQEQSEITIQANSLFRNPAESFALLQNVKAQFLPEVVTKAAQYGRQSLMTTRGVTQSPKVMSIWLYHALDTDFDTTFSTASWAITNTIEQTRGSKKKSVREIFRALKEALMVTVYVGDVLQRQDERLLTISSETLTGSESLAIFPTQQREKALANIRHFLEERVVDYVKIIDPYFEPSSLNVLRFIDPAIPVLILSGGKGSTEEMKREYESAWRTIADQRPDSVRFCIIGDNTKGTCPFHDRFVVTEGAGLLLGYSFNGYGSRTSSILELSAEEAAKVEREYIDFHYHSANQISKNKLIRPRIFDL